MPCIWDNSTSTGNGTTTFLGSNTFNDFKVDAGRTVLFTANTTTTLTTFTVSGATGATTTIGSLTAAPHYLTKAGGGTISSDYLSLSRSNATPTATWYAGTHSVDGGNNTGWVFAAPNQVPTDPTSLGPAGYTDTLWTSSTAPALQFTQSDPDAADTVKFTIQIATTSDYSSKTIDYTSSLAVAGSATFTVGQAAAGGTYTAGSQGQTLTDNSYYWRVMTTDNNNATSSWVNASSGIAFKVDATAPGSLAITSITADATTSLTVFATATDSGSGLAASPFWFAETTQNPGGSSSTDWQTNATLTDAGLTPNTRYDYQAKARDAAGNESSYSATSSKYTLASVPSALVATVASGTQINVTWQANSNPANTEYYCQNTTASTTSGWTTVLTWISSGLSCNTSYSFKVKARNQESTQTDYTDFTNAVTDICCGDTICNGAESCSSCAGDCGVCPATGGGGMPSSWYGAPQAPQGGFAILINDGALETNNPSVKLSLTGGQDTARMAVSNFSDFHDAGQEPYTTTKQWNLCQGQTLCQEGTYVVFAKFYTPWGTDSGVVSDTIDYQKEKTIIEKIEELPEKIIEIIKPKPEEIPLPPIEEVVQVAAPPAFQSIWQLLPQKPIESFVLSPLPKEIQDLAQKFPELQQTFESLGITKITDVEKLQGIKLTLPGLTERLGLKAAKVEPGKLALPKDVPLTQLSAELKKEIPPEIIFAKTGGQLIDLSINLTITEKGEPRQTIVTISGKPLQLAVKPESPVSSVKGYVVFLSKTTAKESNPKVFGIELPLDYFLGSVISSFAKAQEEPIEQKLVLLEFDYHDQDQDGIYTATIQSPQVEGEYEIITVMNYQDVKLGTKEVRLIAVVDPEGYVYEKAGDKETRIPGATVSLFWQNPKTSQYELWPAQEYQQENPQTTDITGKYSFLVPEGSYYLKVVAPGYLAYLGESFSVKEGGGVHFNIELKNKNWWLKIFDWKTILLIAVVILLSFNFYRDKIRDKSAKKD